MTTLPHKIQCFTIYVGDDNLAYLNQLVCLQERIWHEFRSAITFGAKEGTVS